nr:hypothetical protein [Tanacetum cinerariifolium]
MGYEHLSITLEMESNEVTESNVENLLPIPSECELFSITRLISNIESLKDNSTLDCVFDSFEYDNSLLDNFLPEFKTFCDHSEETRSGNTTHANYSLPNMIRFALRLSPIRREPPDDNFDLEPEVISAVMEDIDEPDEHFDPGGEIFFSTNIEDVDYFPFMFVIRIFLPYLILPEISPLFLSAESEDTIFDPGISD